MPERPPFTSDDRTSCFFCGTAPAAWAHDVRGPLVGTDGRGMAIGNDLLTVCDPCEALVRAGAHADLAALEAAHPQHSGRISLPSLLQAIEPGRRLERSVEAPDVARLLAAGWLDLDSLTGVVEQLAPLWPAEHARTIADRRPNRFDDGDRVLVRSPWPELSVVEVLDLLWRWVERDDDGLDVAVWAARVREVFGWSGAQARAVLDGPDPRPGTPA